MPNNEKIEINAIAKFLVLKCNNLFKAVPLELVLRLEEIDVSKIETIGDKKVIQYMNSLMYLELLNPDYKIPTKGKQQVVVFSDNEHILGLVVEKIVDIVSQNIENNLSFDQSNLTALVLGDKTMDIINVNDYFESLLFNSHNEENAENFKYKILLVEESPYFLKLINSVLKIEGFDVLTAKSGDEALKIIESTDKSFNLLLTDINLSNMDGFALAKSCKQNLKSQNIIAIGLTSNIDNVKEAQEEGLIDHFVAKFNNEELIKLVYSLLNGSKQEK